MPYEDWSYAVTSQDTPKIASKQKEHKRERLEQVLPWSLHGEGLCQYLNTGFLACRYVKKYVSAVLSQPVGTTLLQQL